MTEPKAHKNKLTDMQKLLNFIDSIKRYNVLEIELSGEIPEEEERFPLPFLRRRKKLTLWDFERLFRYASNSPKVLAVLIKIKDLRIGLAKAEAMRRGVLELRKKGKAVFVYLESGDNIGYLIGSAAEKIFMPPWAMLNLIGLSAEVTFFKDALDKLGIEAQIKGLGEYKSAAETFTRKTMSEPHKTMMDSIIGDLFSQFVKYVSQGRGRQEKTITALIDEGPFLAHEALRKGLIDETIYESDLEKEIEDVLSLRVQKISARGFLKLLSIREKVQSIIDRIRGNTNTIALVADSGIITLGESRGSGSAKTLGSETLIRILKRLAEDKRINAIVLRISTPGGSGVASDLIRQQVKSISEKKPVVISMSDVAASGGYMIALGAGKIVADSMSLTGSIGIVLGKFNLDSFLKKLGVTKEWVTRGKRALIFSSNKGFTKKEEEKLDVIMESFYRDFVEKVAQARAMEFESAELLARGRVWTGKQAKETGLVDELGGINEAIEIAKKQAGIPEEAFPTVRFISKPKGIQFTPIGKGFAFGIEFDSLIQSLRHLEREKVLALMPFWIEVK